MENAKTKQGYAEKSKEKTGGNYGEENLYYRDRTYKWRRVADAFAELYEESDIVVLDAGHYDLAELQYFRAKSGFNSNTVFDDSVELFEELWENWMDVQLMKIAEGTPVVEMDYEDIFKCLPEEKQIELVEKRKFFVFKAGIDLDK